ncbi:RNA-binding S4 domain-containing protein [uncultured Roseobacter sp.]|uniref:RNA-binding S4 domain-containing protein n=1 Tax=uncultured Roseobacter sp. TaxID=114847 RepID=UPI002626E648|nr:RNA-binding S4 domain-containing protein [uncultured Roseobacter sp.]
MAEKLRLDKWLWHARFFKTRSLAATRVAAGDVRVNGVHTQKRSQMVGPEDVLTFAQGDHIRVIRIDAIGTRRGPAPEAQELYTDLSPPEAKSKDSDPKNPAYEGKGRPTKRNRRILDLSKARSLE